ncbi:MAG: 50S ribosomal protein L6 [Opitutales bacterium]
MSRIGKLPVDLPEKVTAEVQGQTVKVNGPRGSLEQTFNRKVLIKLEDNALKVSPKDQSQLARSMYGTARSILANMVTGVTEGYTKNLEINGVGFRATLNGKVLDLALGYSHNIQYPVPDGITVTVTDGTKVTVEGIDKQAVGQVAATIKGYYPVEPYKGKGVRIVGDFVRRKEGKKTA